MGEKRILTVQDISCVGQCSLTVALPILSACGLETCVLPTAVLSTHTGGFSGYTFRDLTEDMPAIAEHWRREGIGFDAFYTGYLGSVAQISHVLAMMNVLGKPGALRVVDPAMADSGTLYAGFTDAFVEAMRPLCSSADVILPNLTEACLLSGIPYRTEYDGAYVESILDALMAVGAPVIVLTGVSYDEKTTGVVVRDDRGTLYYRHKKVERFCHGAGDVFASALVGAAMNGVDWRRAAEMAADYTVACIENTVKDPSHWYGVYFESVLPDFVRRLQQAVGSSGKAPAM